MKLTKPPIPEKKTALEAYVDFWLTDLSNVTPIRPAKIEVVEPAAIGFGLDSDTSHDPESAFSRLETSQQETSQQEISQQETSQQEISQKKASEASRTDDAGLSQVEDPSGFFAPLKEPLTQPEFETEPETVPADLSETFPQASVPEIAFAVEEKLQTETSVREKAAHSRPESHQFFVAENEADELKKWDALLTREKEQQILAERVVKESKHAGQAPGLSHRDQLARENLTVSSPNKPASQITKTASSGFINARELSIGLPRSAVLQSEKSRTEPEPEALPIFQAEKQDLESSLLLDERLAGVQRLLANITLTQPKLQAESKVHLENPYHAKPVSQDLPLKSASKSALTQAEPISDNQTVLSAESVHATFLQRRSKRNRDVLPDIFQTLIFKVGKLPLAVPLLKLGGIVAIDDVRITPLVGTPQWFLGLLPSERGNLMVVDTQLFLMPERCATDKIEPKSYQYLIILDDTNWALACHSVGDAKNLMQDEVRWAEKSSKRPWFGGMVLQYMSALLEVDELINMLAGNISD